jgi:hypothetical protein
MTNASESVGECPAPSRNILLLFALTLGIMGTQLVVPGSGGRLALADPFIGLSFLALLLHVWRTRGAAAIPAPIPVVLVLYGLMNVFAQAHRAGAIEVAQRVEFLFCGVLVLGWLLKYRPKWAAKAVAAALGASLLVALVQGMKYGFGSTIPPKDVTELPLGFGKAFTGLFRSRLALGLFLGMALVWLQPMAYAKAKTWKCWTGITISTAVVLGFVAHGQLLVIAAAAALLFGFLHSTKAGLANLVALALLALSLGFGNRAAVLADTMSPMADKYGTLKPGHLEIIPAFRLANEHPWRGIGAGDAYQKHIGTAYKLLPRENVNDMEADSQSGYGILFATVGYPTGLLLVALLIWGVGLGIRSYFVAGQPAALGSAAVLAVVLGAMWVTDPFTKGNAWFVALGLAGAWTTGPVWKLDIRGLLGLCVGFAVLGGLVLVAGHPKPVTDVPAAPSARPSASTSSEKKTNVWDSGAFGASGFMRVIDAAEAIEIGKPMVKESDSQAAKGTVLNIPDKTHVPPNEKSAGLKHGGASFEIDAPEDLTCKVWVRVWWEGSCGNTLFVRLGKDGHLLRVGDDGTYKAWHWMSAPDTVNLKKGKNTIYILNREDGIRFDQMLITDDMGYYPQGIEKNEDE